MSLSKQLLCVALLLLALPWFGVVYLQEIYRYLQESQQHSLASTTEVIARSLAAEPKKLHPHQVNPLEQPFSAGSLYCHPHSAPVWIDGYDEEWREIPANLFESDDQQLSVNYRCGIHQQTLSLFFNIKDSEVLYNNPSKSLAANGDRLLIYSGDGRTYILTAVAPGQITARYFLNPHTTFRESQIKATWIDNSEGYQIELQMPLALARGKLQFGIIDQDSGKTVLYRELNGELPWIIYRATAVSDLIRIYQTEGVRHSLFDPYGRLLARNGTTATEQDQSIHWLLRKSFRAILRSQQSTKQKLPVDTDISQRREFIEALNGSSASIWYRDENQRDRQILSNATPIIAGGKTVAVLISEQSSEQSAALTDRAFGQLFLTSMLVIALTALILLAYASWLSWRIRKLSRAAQQALDDNGQVCTLFPTSNAKDEIGSLTRNYAELMQRVSEYTDYLQTLSRKLSHELRTPIAIIQSSLDNLSSHSSSSESGQYIQRAKDGTQRLSSILTAMSEARRVEESIQQAETEQTNIAKLLWEMAQAYREIYSDHPIKLVGAAPEQQSQAINMIEVVPELLVQMMDKLIDNANSFCRDGGEITIEYRALRDSVEIKVGNDGPLLPETMRHQLFDNMVSLRKESSDAQHLGLGLYIVKLIVDYHRGKISANNRQDGSGVCFQIELPRERR